MIISSNSIRYRLFHIIKDVEETTETKKVKDKKTYVVNTSIRRRHLFRNFISWVLSIDTWQYEYKDEEK